MSNQDTTAAQTQARCVVCGFDRFTDESCARCGSPRGATKAAPVDAAEFLATHRAIWDMPTLAEQRTDIIQHLAGRYEVDFDMSSFVVVVHRDGTRVEHFETYDVREVVATLLEREAGAR